MHKSKGVIKMKEILVETSARHIHLSQEAVDVLFGKGYTLTNKKDLSQPGQFACAEKLDVVGPKGKIKASILGPTRPDTQVELSLTDARTIGVSAPIRESGSIAGTPGCKLVNPENGAEYEIATGVIAAKRHIHLTPADAEEIGVADKQIVSVKVNTADRATIFGDVVCRVSDKFATAMHIDTDESNAACAFGNVYGVVIK